jgi:hypothetical protein
MNMYPCAYYENVGSISDPDYEYASPVIAKNPNTVTDYNTDSVIKKGKMYVINGF